MAYILISFFFIAQGIAWAGVDLAMSVQEVESYEIPDFYNDIDMLGFLRTHRWDGYLEHGLKQKVEQLWKQENHYDFHRDLKWNIHQQERLTRIRIRTQQGLNIVKNLKSNVGAYFYAGSIPLKGRVR